MISVEEVVKVCAPASHVNKLVSKAVLSLFVIVKTKSVGQVALVDEVTFKSSNVYTSAVAPIT